MPTTPMDQNHHALLELQKRHTKLKMMAGIPPHPDENWTHPITGTPPQNQKSRIPNLSKLPQSRQNSHPQSHCMHGVCISERTHGEPPEEGSQVHEYPTHQSEGFPITVQIHPQHKLLPQLGQGCIDQMALGAHNPTEPDENSPSDHPTTLTSLKKAVPLHTHVCEALVEFNEPTRCGQMQE